MLVTRTTKGQVQTYEYHKKDNANDAKLNMRLSTETLGKAKAVAEYLGYNNYSKFIRDLIDIEASKYHFTETTTLGDTTKIYKVITE